MHLPRPQLPIEHIPCREPVVALRFEEIEHQTPQSLISPDDERSRRNLDVLTFEPACHRRLMVSLERTLGVSHSIDHELVDGSPCWSAEAIHANTVCSKDPGH